MDIEKLKQIGCALLVLRQSGDTEYDGARHCLPIVDGRLPTCERWESGGKSGVNLTSVGGSSIDLLVDHEIVDVQVDTYEIDIGESAPWDYVQSHLSDLLPKGDDEQSKPSVDGYDLQSVEGIGSTLADRIRESVNLSTLATVEDDDLIVELLMAIKGVSEGRAEGVVDVLRDGPTQSVSADLSDDERIDTLRDTIESGAPVDDVLASVSDPDYSEVSEAVNTTSVPADHTGVLVEAKQRLAS